MFLSVLFVSITVAAVASLLGAIRVGDRTLQVISKTAASAAFVSLGLARHTPGNTVYTWLVAGLILCAIGDFCLLYDRSFDVGLISFLFGHLAYVAGFNTAYPITLWPIFLVAPLTVAGTGVMSWLWPHLGRKRVPVVAYIMAITLMVWGAVSAVLGDALPLIAAIGAVLFYLSDLTVARERFVHSSFNNRFLGLPKYYAGQLLLAFTIGS